MNEQLLEFGLKLLKRAHLVGTGILLALLLVVIALLFQELNHNEPSPEAMAPAKYEAKIPSPQYDKTRALYLDVQPSIEKDEKARRTIENNMFDLKSIKDAKALEEKVKDNYLRAEKLFQDQHFPEAQKTLGEVLAVYPTYSKALDLQERLSKALATPAPTGTGEAKK